MNRQATLPVLFLAIAIFNIGVGMIIPILPLYAQTYGASTFVIGLMVSALTIGRLLMQGPGGYLTDLYGAQKIAAEGGGI
jgi:MFS family permease